jgi:DNA-directed RNA polymerase subunit L
MNKERENDTEQISDDDLLYRRFHRTNLRRDGGITYAAYMQRNPTMPDPEISVNLASRTTPEETLAAAALPIFGLGMLRVGDVRRLGFTVRYKPTRNNIAHCIIEGAKTETDCARLAEITRVHTPPPRKSST